MVKNDPTTLYTYPEAADIDAIAQAVKVGQSLSRAGLYWNAFCLREVGSPKFWPKQTLRRSSPDTTTIIGAAATGPADLPGAVKLSGKVPRMAQASAMFRALGDPARLRLLAKLAGGEAYVTELADADNEKLTTVSARLRTLHQARLVKRRREAKHICYTLFDTHVVRLVQSAMEHAAERQ